MKINWKVRFRNPLFWAQVIVSIVAPILAYFGLKWEDMTTWNALGEIFVDAVQNPVVITGIIASVWHTVTDPTTRGIGDSERALTYEVPRK